MVISSNQKCVAAFLLHSEPVLTQLVSIIASAAAVEHPFVLVRQIGKVWSILGGSDSRSKLTGRLCARHCTIVRTHGNPTMYPVFAEVRDGTKLFYWNLDGTVGLNGTNYVDDVLFVQ
ncbi:hypothetical protein GCM10007874_46550 [Labrys miyagiensis]|uniref:Uncharacterized protein n=1 Tax=Labrys miyagiensis TaxID=346912 RepID=A0ABQ6CPD9_9HYPH|nr:hypothetical protein GCM10007874_46550 [Labrys miyagiensis]